LEEKQRKMQQQKEIIEQSRKLQMDKREQEKQKKQ
jgi:hypothetical protein